MKRVLVPLDGTKHAEAALPFLEQFCSAGDSLVLLSVSRAQEPARTGSLPGQAVAGSFAGPSGGVIGIVTPDVPTFQETKDQSQERQLNEARDYLEGLAVGLRAAGLEVKTEALTNDHPANAILDYAKAMKPTFIAMLRRTHFGLNELLFGSVATQVMQAEVAPVLFIPANGR